MSFPFAVITDRRGRINSFVPADFPDTRIKPADMAERLDGGERVRIRGAEYDLHETGSLIHPSVIIIGSVMLGNGVRLDSGTVLSGDADADREAPPQITIGDRTRIGGTAVSHPTTIGRSAVILAQSMGTGNNVGDETRIGAATVIYDDVTIGAFVRIDRDGMLLSGATVEEHARLRHGTRVGAGAVVGHHATVGNLTGIPVGAKDIDRGGPLIPDGKVIPPYAVI
jgi:carbonic anhydrase/acetyltransferase-like protein (isoleucine patch superfamily)